MRNVFMQKIDNILIDYYKEVNFEEMSSESFPVLNTGVEERFQVHKKSQITNGHRIEAMKIIDLMKELELLSPEEFILLKEIYGEYFSLNMNG